MKKLTKIVLAFTLFMGLVGILAGCASKQTARMSLFTLDIEQRSGTAKEFAKTIQEDYK